MEDEREGKTAIELRKDGIRGKGHSRRARVQEGNNKTEFPGETKKSQRYAGLKMRPSG